MLHYIKNINGKKKSISICIVGDKCHWTDWQIDLLSVVILIMQPIDFTPNSSEYWPHSNWHLRRVLWRVQRASHWLLFYWIGPLTSPRILAIWRKCLKKSKVSLSSYGFWRLTILAFCTVRSEDVVLHKTLWDENITLLRTVIILFILECL